MANRYMPREDAPFGNDLWKVLDEAVIAAARSELVGRRMLPLKGPFGFGAKSVSLQDEINEDSLTIAPTLPLTMIREPFELGMRDLASFERDGLLVHVKPVETAALKVARGEDQLLFNGVKEAPGLLNSPGVNKLGLLPWDDIGTAANAAIQAITVLDQAGFHGPYTMALAPKRYNMLFRRYPQGHQTEMDHLATMVTGGVYKAPLLDDGGVILALGLDPASIILGQDITIGFVGPAGGTLEFYIAETVALHVRYAEAVCVLEAQ